MASCGDGLGRPLQVASVAHRSLCRLVASVQQITRYSLYHYLVACTGGNQPSATAAGCLRPRQLALISEKSQSSVSRQRGMKPQRKAAGGGKSEQHPHHPQPTPSSVQSAAGGARQESDSTGTSERARTDHRPAPKIFVCKESAFII